MQLEQNDLEKYKAIYKATYGNDISKENALIQANALINLMKLALHNNFDYGS